MFFLDFFSPLTFPVLQDDILVYFTQNKYNMDKIVHIFFNQTWKSGQFTRTTCATKFCFPIKIYFVVGKILGEVKGAFP